jgi:hypothetical protein
MTLNQSVQLALLKTWRRDLPTHRTSRGVLSSFGMLDHRLGNRREQVIWITRLLDDPDTSRGATPRGMISPSNCR